ncbi:hypothetical protein DICA3_D16402 [Diutina catenulata]
MLRISVRLKSSKTSFLPPELRRSAKRLDIGPLPTPKKPTPSPQPSAKDGASKVALVKEILGEVTSWKKPGYYDPANTSLDLTRPNHELWDDIYAGSLQRYRLRYKQPSTEWTRRAGGVHTVEDLTSAVSSDFSVARVTAESLNQPIAVGDVVSLSGDSSNFFLVIATAKSLEVPTYTFVDKKGEIQFAPKAAVRLRCPGVVAPEKAAKLASMVVLERKHMDVAPVGVADDEFSKSVASLPRELQSRMSAADEPSHRSPEPTSRSSSSPDTSEPADFLVAQAASQLLTNTDVNTWIVPEAARDVYSHALTNLTIQVHHAISELDSKLELVHRGLQYDSEGSVINNPRSVSLWQLLAEIDKLDREPQSYVQSRAKAANQTSTVTSCSAATYLALVTALSRQPRLWQVESYGVFAPSSVTILPIDESAAVDRVITHLKYHGGSRQFADYCIGVIEGKKPPLPKYYDEIIGLFKSWIAGSTHGDPVVETLLVNIVRAVANSSTQASPPYSLEYSKARAYDILMAIGSGNLVNPNRWSQQLRLPNEHISRVSDYSKTYYEGVDAGIPSDNFYTKKPVTSEQAQASPDPLATVRKRFNEPVFCIDAPDAHEIDDGIALVDSGDTYTVYVHVANPGSYMRPDSAISRMAMAKGTTTYMPEGPEKMLPEAISELAGLGTDNPTRTFAVSYQFDKQTVDDYLAQRDQDPNHRASAETLEKMKAQLDASIAVGAYTAHNFPSGYTYDRVNEVLETRMDPHFLPLYKLHGIATMLHDYNITVGGGVDLSNDPGSVKVDTVAASPTPQFTNTPDEYRLQVGNRVIRIARPKSGTARPSQTLVSQCMVYANYASAKFAAQRDIGLVFRTQEMNLAPSVERELAEVVARGDMSPGNLSKVTSVLVGSRYSVTPKKHQSLGIECYATVTSPLRRYVDMINQWRLCSALMGSDSQLAVTPEVAQHLSTREVLNKFLQKHSNKFWLGQFLRHYLALLRGGDIADGDAIQWRLLVRSSPKIGSSIQVDVLGFNHMRARLEVTPANRPYLEQLEVGQVFEPTDGRLDIKTVDFIEDELTFVYN